MFNYVSEDYLNLIHLQKAIVNDEKQKITYYWDGGKIQTLIIADAAEYAEKADVITSSFVDIDGIWYNISRIGIVKMTGPRIWIQWFGGKVFDKIFEDETIPQAIVDAVEPTFIEINGKWYNSEQLHVARTNSNTFTIQYDWLGRDLMTVVYEDSTAFDEAISKIEAANEGGGGGGGGSRTAAPTFEPKPGKVAPHPTVTISCATDGATIHYTTDGTDPDLDSPVYSTPISFNADTTIKACAVKLGLATSKISVGNYVIDIPAVADPVFSVPAGTVDPNTSLEITCATDGADIYYTTDGTDPDETSTKYTAAIVINRSMTVKAVATKEDYKNSKTISRAYHVDIPTVATPTFSPAAGEVDRGTEVTISCTTAGAVIHYTTDGTNPDATSPVYDGTPIEITAAMTIKAMATAADMLDSSIGSAAYTVKMYRYAGMYNEVPNAAHDDYDEAYVIKLENIDTIITGLDWFETNIYNAKADAKLAANTKSLGTPTNEWSFGANADAEVGYQEVYAYPKSLGSITQITNNSFDATGSFDQHEMTFDGVVYNVIFLRLPVGAPGDTQKLSFN